MTKIIVLRAAGNIDTEIRRRRASTINIEKESGSIDIAGREGEFEKRHKKAKPFGGDENRLETIPCL